MVEAQKETFSLNEVAKGLKGRIILREKEEDAKIYQYGIQKQQELDARKASELQKQAEKRAQQDRMIVAAESQLQAAMHGEQKWLIKQKKETEEKEAEEERRKLERKAYLKKTMEDNRQIWMKEKVKGVKAEVDENRKFQEQWRLKNIEIVIFSPFPLINFVGKKGEVRGRRNLDNEHWLSPVSQEAGR